MSRRLSSKDLALLKNDLGAELPPPVPRKKRNNEEWRIQCDFFLWWWAAAPGLGVWRSLCFHIPNSSFLSGTKEERARRGRWANMAGVTSGVPDVFLAVPSDGIRSDHERREACFCRFGGLFIEFKKPSERNKKNGGCSDSQMEFMGFALARGYQTAVAYSWEEGRDAVVEYLNQ